MATQISAALPFGFRVLRRVRPILRLGSTYVVTLHDDVREVFGTDTAFQVPYKPNLDVITGGEPFFLGMADTPEYHAGVAAMRRVVHEGDLPGLAARAELQAEAIVSSSGGRVEVVDQLVRRVTFDMMADYFGVPAPSEGASTCGRPGCSSSSSPVHPRISSSARRWTRSRPCSGPTSIAKLPVARPGGEVGDDVLARCLALQAAGVSRVQRRRDSHRVLCMLVGGPPQPPMVVPQAMEQLLRRPDASLPRRPPHGGPGCEARQYHTGGHALRSACSRSAANCDQRRLGGARHQSPAEDPERRDRHCGIRLGNDGRPSRSRPHASIRTGVPTSTSILVMACISASGGTSTAPPCT